MFTGVFKERTSTRPTAVAARDALSRILQSRVLRAHHFACHVEVGPFVVDYVCRERALIVELARSNSGQSQQQARIAFLTQMGYRVLTLTRHEVAKSSAVIDRIQCALRG
jgi:very-short-patch-repair endonuclease